VFWFSPHPFFWTCPQSKKNLARYYHKCA
jgi:hypothetical protein